MQFDEIGIKAELNLIFNYEVVGALLVKFVLHVFRVFTLLFMNHKWIFVKKKFWIKKHFQYMQPYSVYCVNDAKIVFPLYYT